MNATDKATYCDYRFVNSDSRMTQVNKSSDRLFAGQETLGRGGKTNCKLQAVSAATFQVFNKLSDRRDHNCARHMAGSSETGLNGCRHDA